MSDSLPSPLSLVPGPSDRELATKIKATVREVLGPVLAALTDAKSNGFDVTFSIQTDGFGQSFLQTLRVTKEF